MHVINFISVVDSSALCALL